MRILIIFKANLFTSMFFKIFKIEYHVFSLTVCAMRDHK